MMSVEDARDQGYADGAAGRASRYLEFATDAGRSQYIVAYANAVRAKRAAGER